MVINCHSCLGSNIYLPTYLLIYLPTYLPIYLSIYLSNGLPNQREREREVVVVIVVNNSKAGAEELVFDAEAYGPPPLTPSLPSHLSHHRV